MTYDPRRTVASAPRTAVLLATACFLGTLATTACARVPAATPEVASAPSSGRANELSAAEQAAGWRLLFNGRTLNGWRGLGRDTIPTAHWMVQDGAIRKIPSGQIQRRPDGQPLAGGDLMTVGTFGDFELTWEWKVAPGANSGLKYNVSEALSKTMAPHAALGFEYQIIDDERHEDGKIPSHRSGALYDLIPPSAGKRLRPPGEWNSSALIFRGTHGEHWLNGARIVEFDLGTARMDSLLALSKYKAIKDFATRRTGHIVLQDHGDEVWFRSIKIRYYRTTAELRY
jgi:hypothetical protein